MDFVFVPIWIFQNLGTNIILGNKQILILIFWQQVNIFLFLNMDFLFSYSWILKEPSL